MSDSGRPAPLAKRELIPGELLIRFPAGGAVAFRIEGRHEKSGWRVREAATVTRAEFPGTAVDVEGTWYEVTRVEALADGRIAYDLAPWEDRFPIRRGVAYNVAELEREAHERAERDRRERRAGSVLLAAPIFGLAPAATQRRLEATLRVPATHLTIASALLVGIPSLIVMLLGVAAGIGGAMGADAGSLRIFARLMPFGFVGFIESGLRIASAWIAGEPMGSLLGLPWRWLEDKRAAPDDLAMTPTVVRHDALPPIDRVRILADGEKGDLEILSALPKPAWNRNHAIGYGGRWYRLASTRTLAGPPVEHRFVLRLMAEDELVGGAVEYAPEEVIELHRDTLRAQARTWIDTFTAMWGLLDGDTQERLERELAHDAERATLESLVLVGGLAFIAVSLAVHWVLAGVGGCLEIVLLPAGIAFVAESLVRARSLREGVVRGSVLAPAVRPFALRLLAGLEDPLPPAAAPPAPGA